MISELLDKKYSIGVFITGSKRGDLEGKFSLLGIGYTTFKRNNSIGYIIFSLNPDDIRYSCSQIQKKFFLYEYFFVLKDRILYGSEGFRKIEELGYIDDKNFLKLCYGKNYSFSIDEIKEPKNINSYNEASIAIPMRKRLRKGERIF